MTIQRTRRGHSQYQGPFAGVSISELGERLRNGTTTVPEIVEFSLSALRQFNEELNCFNCIDAEGARAAARALQRALDSGNDYGPLHGIPIGIKDLIDVEGLPTTCGSHILARNIAVRDAAVVQSLREAGAVIIGKTHTHEFAYGPTGDVAATGPCRNPLDLQRMSGGSSSGSASAVAAGIVVAAIGTDTGGSVRIPAALCGITGLRPTTGAMSSNGIFPLAQTFDTAGPMAKSVEDVAAIWEVFSSKLHQDDTSGTAISIAVLESELSDKVSANISGAVKHAAMLLRESSHQVGVLELPQIDRAWDIYNIIGNVETFAVHAEWVADRPNDYQPETLARLCQAQRETASSHASALNERERMRDAVFKQSEHVDIILTAATPITAPLVGQRGSKLGGGWTDPKLALLSQTTPWSLLGWPAIAVPVGYDDESDLPLAVQLIAKPGHERKLLEMARILEVRVAPTSSGVGQQWS